MAQISIDYGNIVDVHGYTMVAQLTTSVKEHTITGLTVGDKLIVILVAGSSSSQPYAQYDGATCTGGSITKICNLFPSNSYARGTFYQVNCTSTEITVTHTVNHQLLVLKYT